MRKRTPCLWLSNTVKLRHEVVKALAPKLYAEWQSFHRQKYLNTGLLQFENMSPAKALELWNQVPRPSIKFISSLHTDTLIGAEVGVFEGRNAESILNILNMRKMFLIDSYEDSELEWSELTGAQALANARARLCSFHQCEWIIRRSNEAAEKVPYDQLDFVYIDGNHDFIHVAQDLENYYPKLKKNGFLCGHDFNITYSGLIKAVTEFAWSNHLKLSIEMPDFWMQKP
jgi:hypothetical protein